MEISRREFVKTGASLACAGMAVSESRLEHSAMTAVNNSKINVLLIHVDQQRIECLGAYGNPDIKTPHIDRLAEEGVRYEQSFCPYPICTPSRYSLLSGLYVHDHRGWDNHCTLAPDIPTFPRLLREAGYATQAVGKMHFTPTYLDVGFDVMYLAEQDGPGRWDDDYHRALMEAGLADINDLEDQRREYRRNARPAYWETFGALPSNLPEKWHSTTWIGDRVVDAIDSWADAGNLLMAGFIKPHHPFDPPPNLADAHDPDRLELLPGWTEACLPHDIALHGGYFPHERLHEKALRRIMAYYYATIEHIDAQVGRMIDLLKRKGLYDNTLIIFTGDHGEYMGFHHLLLKGNHLYDPVVKVPLIIKYPAGATVSGGRVSHALVNNIDLAPTILAQAGIAPAAGMTGHNLAQTDASHDVVFCEHLRGDQVMARTRTHKLICSRQHDYMLFYDLEEDPNEMNNRVDDPACRDAVAMLEAAAEAWRPRTLRPETHLDYDAPVICRPNVPPRDNSHRAAIAAWYDAKMQDALG